MSYLPVIDCEGTCSPYKVSPTSPNSSALSQLKQAGWTSVRVRIWNNPQGSFAESTYANITHVAAFALRIKEAGLDFWLDFHYSDTWADPGHQYKPQEWYADSPPDLVTSLYNFTHEILTILKAQGTPPQIVQIGNEIDNGMLWAESGQACTDGAYLWGACDNWPFFASLIAAGQRAVRDVLGSTCFIVVHSSRGSVLGSAGGVRQIAEFYLNLTKNNADDFDAAGLSFYPHWGAGNSSNLANLAQLESLLPGKYLVIAETAYPWQGSAVPGQEFPYTPQGQLQYIQSAIQHVREVKMAAGVSWWGGEYYNQSTGAGYTALWDLQGVAQPAMVEAMSTMTEKKTTTTSTTDILSSSSSSSSSSSIPPLAHETPILQLLRSRILAQQIPAPSAVASSDALIDYFLSVFSPATYTFTDIDYEEMRAASWPCVNHTIRTLLMATATFTPLSKYNNSTMLFDYSLGALRWWLARDLIDTDNWWDNQIGVPKNIGPAALIFQAQLNSSEIATVDAILNRSVTKGWTGANLVWQGENLVYKGVFDNDLSLVQEACTAAYTAISTSTFPQDGIQADGAFFQHGPQIYNGGYGADFTSSVLSLLGLTTGTPLAYTDQTGLAEFANFLVDGELRTIFYPPAPPSVLPPRFDISVCGRGITRPAASVYIGLSGAAQVPFAPNVLRTWQGPRADEIYAFADLLEFGCSSGNTTTAVQIGSRALYAADAGFHTVSSSANVMEKTSMEKTSMEKTSMEKKEKEKNDDNSSNNNNTVTWTATVRTHSSRLLGSECVNEEGKLSAHLADGAMYLYKTGREYYDGISGSAVFPAWDWEKIPGTTVEHLGIPLDCNNVSGIFGIRAFAGGAQDAASSSSSSSNMTTTVGKRLVMAVDWAAPQSQHLSIKKSWHMYQDMIVCLGSNMTTVATTSTMFTTIEQRLVQSEVYTSNNPNVPVPDESINITIPMIQKTTSSFSSSSYAWVWHDGVGYIIFPPMSSYTASAVIMLSVNNRTGNWYDIGVFNGTQTIPMFTLWIEHVPPLSTGGSYAYVVVPNAPNKDEFVNIIIPSLILNTTIVNSQQAHGVVHSDDDENESSTMTLAVFDPTGANVDGGSGWNVTTKGPGTTVLVSSSSSFSVSFSNPSHSAWDFALDIDRTLAPPANNPPPAGMTCGAQAAPWSVLGLKANADGSTQQIVCGIGA